MHRQRMAEPIASEPIRCCDFSLLSPVAGPALVLIEQVCRARVRPKRILPRSTDQDLACPDEYPMTKSVICRQIARDDLFHFAPVIDASLVAVEKIGRSAAGGGWSPDQEQIGLQPERLAEVVRSRSVGGRDLGYLPPVVRAAFIPPEEVNGALAAGVADGADRDRVLVDRHRYAKIIVQICIGGDDLFHQPPIIRAALVPLVDICSTAPAVVRIRANDQSVAMEGCSPAVKITGSAVTAGGLFHLTPVIRPA